MAVAGVAAKKKDGQTVSGDTGAWFKHDDGSLYVLLCDGMGSGSLAEQESALAVRLLEQFLRAGVRPENALRTLNSALALRNDEAAGGFTTIDLLRVDLFTGEAGVYKYGAAPTYVKKGYSVSRITGTALPAGLTAGEGVSPDVTRLQLEAGDCVLLVTDGVAGSASDQWVRDRLAAFDGGSPRELAQALIDGSGGRRRRPHRSGPQARPPERMKQQPPEPKGSGGCFLQSGRCSLFENLYLFKQTSVLIFLHNIPQMKGKNKRYC